ncbi:MAG: penicillin-binding protein [Nitrospira bacterium HGW-Nitrospira-1]|nr:MAG: penicillin-binding protein [Nitrospira bacterium HGW-Nitrospira-1]
MNRRRIVILNTVIVFGFFAVFFRLTDLMVFNHAIYAERAKSQQVKAEDIQVRRGNIYDRKGRAFAVNLELESLYCDSKEVVVDKDGLQRLSGILGMDAKVIQAKFKQGKRFTWINRKLAQDTAAQIKKLKIDGIGFVPEAKRYYPKGILASHVIGMVGRENQPLEGLELKYNKYLSIAGGKVYFARDASGKQLSSGVDMEEAKGNDLLLTLDEALQYIVEKELDKAMAQWKSVAASAIMMDPFTGEILALANRPAYDLNDTGRANQNAIRNRVITDIYEPGSTFKVIIGTAALEEKLYNLDSKFDCSRGAIEVGGKVIRDAHRHGMLTFKEVIQKSSNVGSIMIGMKLGKERLYRYAKLYGFGDETGIDMPGEVSGWIRKPDSWSATSIGAIPIGQEVAVTPLQILRAYSAIANGGSLVQPHLVSEIRTPEGRTIFSFQGETKRVLTEKTAKVFKDILKTVVEVGGTATEAAVEGNQVAGKTGTAQLIDHRTGRYSKDRFISSFVGFVPADNPKIAMIVVIYEPKGQIYGGIVAGPVFRDIANQALSYMNVPMDEDYRNDLLLVSK